MVEFDRAFGIASTSCRSSLKLSNLSVCRAIVIPRITITIIHGSRVRVASLPWTPRVTAVNRGLSVSHSGGHRLSRRRRRAEGRSDFNRVGVMRVV